MTCNALAALAALSVMPRRHGRFSAPEVTSVEPMDPYDLSRFIANHAHNFPAALDLLKKGHKFGKFIKPCIPLPPHVRHDGSANVIEGLWVLKDPPRPGQPGVSCTNAARAFLRHPKKEPEGVHLRANLLDLYRVVIHRIAVQKHDPFLMMGSTDVRLMVISARMFERVSRGGFDDEVNAVCRQLLEVMQAPTHEWEVDSNVFEDVAYTEAVRKKHTSATDPSLPSWWV